jgi:phosphate transport system protein
LTNFTLELEGLHQALLAMSSLVEASIHSSIQALVERNARLCERVISDEPQTNRSELDIDARVIRILALHQPVAKDLRLLTAALKINTDLERIGDLAVSISQRVLSLLKSTPLPPPDEIPRMALLVEDMLSRSLDAFVRSDAELAGKVLPADREVDSLRDSVYDKLKEVMRQNPDLVSPAVDLMFIARSLERIGDHATNIAEDVIFLVRGVDVRHHSLDQRP